MIILNSLKGLEISKKEKKKEKTMFYNINLTIF